MTAVFIYLLGYLSICLSTCSLSIGVLSHRSVWLSIHRSKFYIRSTCIQRNYLEARTGCWVGCLPSRPLMLRSRTLWSSPAWTSFANPWPALGPMLVRQVKYLFDGYTPVVDWCCLLFIVVPVVAKIRWTCGWRERERSAHYESSFNLCYVHDQDQGQLRNWTEGTKLKSINLLKMSPAWRLMNTDSCGNIL